MSAVLPMMELNHNRLFTVLHSVWRDDSRPSAALYHAYLLQYNAGQRPASTIDTRRLAHHLGILCVVMGAGIGSCRSIPFRSCVDLSWPLVGRGNTTKCIGFAEHATDLVAPSITLGRRAVYY
jgi:hypothetical protein